MKPLNYAILKYLTKVPEASVDEVMQALKDDYGTFKAFNKKDIVTSLMTAEANGLLEETRFELDGNNEVRVYFRAHAEGAETINKYIRD